MNPTRSWWKNPPTCCSTCWSCCGPAACPSRRSFDSSRRGTESSSMDVQAADVDRQQHLTLRKDHSGTDFSSALINAEARARGAGESGSHESAPPRLDGPRAAHGAEQLHPDD